jgi:PAS domain S-box-containing protein
MAATPSEPDYRELVERAGDMIYTLDREGAFTFVNSAGLALLGYEANEIVGRHFGTVLTPHSGQVAADHFAQGLAGTESTPFFEVQAIRSDSTVIDVEVRAGNLYRDGELVGRQGVARDISSLKALQAQVVEKSERLVLMQEQARVAMDLYRRIAELTLTGPADPEGTERALRSVESSLSLATAEKAGLDAQDVRIAELLSQGCSNREIGEQIHLSPSTVKDRVSKLMRALGARSRAEVVALATRNGLIHVDARWGALPPTSNSISSAATTSGSNWLPATLRNSLSAVS